MYMARGEELPKISKFLSRLEKSKNIDDIYMMSYIYTMSYSELYI